MRFRRRRRAPRRTRKAVGPGEARADAEKKGVVLGEHPQERRKPCGRARALFSLTKVPGAADET